MKLLKLLPFFVPSTPFSKDENFASPSPSTTTSQKKKGVMFLSQNTMTLFDSDLTSTPNTNGYLILTSSDPYPASLQKLSDQFADQSQIQYPQTPTPKNYKNQPNNNLHDIDHEDDKENENFNANMNINVEGNNAAAADAKGNANINANEQIRNRTSKIKPRGIERISMMGKNKAFASLSSSPAAINGFSSSPSPLSFPSASISPISSTSSSPSPSSKIPFPSHPRLQTVLDSSDGLNILKSTSNNTVRPLNAVKSAQLPLPSSTD